MPSKIPIPTSRLIVVAMTMLACGKERPVEAPVVDVAVGTVDASTRPLAIDPTPPVVEESRGPSSPLTGRWEGVGRQDDGQTWALVVDITKASPGLCATADYPTVPCRAQWLCTGAQRGIIQARERLLDDSALRCIDNGTMTMHLGADGMLEWTWTGQGQNAVARLRRAR